MFPLWQKKGHISAHCINLPNAKRKKATDAADVIIDMSPWGEECALWRESQLALASTEAAPGLQSGVVADAAVGDTATNQQPDDHINNEEIHGLEETKGCAILDSGATILCSPTIAAEEIHMQR